MIQKEDIIGYGLGKYESKHVSGDRLRILTKNKSFKFHTSQYENLLDIKSFLRGQKVVSNAFKREERINNIVSLSIIIAVLGFLAFGYFHESAEDEGELLGLGIPVILNDNFHIMSEDAESFTFKIKEYNNYTFIVDKNNTPKNIKNLNKELMVIIDTKEKAQELSRYIKTKSKTAPKTMYVDEVIVLE